MKIKIPFHETVEVSTVEIILPLRGEEDIPNDFPLRRGDLWSALVDIGTGRILDWPDVPKFRKCRLGMKVCLEGTYRLLAKDGTLVAEMVNDYVPNGLVPGLYDTYVTLLIKRGVITNWPKRPDVRRFFKDCVW